ncbi:MAG: sodium:proton antiporter [Lactobacillaceae bacterium]|jgi:CPA1 family monovalent cation:H+ antiporter|nr:sodium:proton antiporter [Lactobacillaceae bacterium]
MSTFYIFSLLIIGVIITNIIKNYIPKIPKLFILIIVGMLISLTPIFNKFELEPDFFMFAIISPIMFIDGQKQTFSKIRKNFSVIWSLSVILAVVTALSIGTIINKIEVTWTLPLAIVLASIIVPTDAVAVKSITNNSELPKNVGEALDLESLFNDATGLVMLDLSLSVLSKGTFSTINALEHFLFVSLGGILIGIVAGLLVVILRISIQQRISNSETNIISISLLTPFIIYMLAEHLGTSGILAVVATGIVHNWESRRIRLTSTNVQLTSRTIWTIISDILNDIVFLFLGISLNRIIMFSIKLGWPKTLQLVAISLFIYIIILLIRYIWFVLRSNDNRRNMSRSEIFIDENNKSSNEKNKFNALIFAISGVHGTITLAMAFSLPYKIGGIVFPAREEITIIATFIVLISLITSSIWLPIVLPEKIEKYTNEDLNFIRDQMIDSATLKIYNVVTDLKTREELIKQLQSQKNKLFTADNNERKTAIYNDLINNTQEFITSYINDDSLKSKYSTDSINIYKKQLSYSFYNNNNKRDFKKIIKYNLKHFLKNLKKIFIWRMMINSISKNRVEDQRHRRSDMEYEYSKKIKKYSNIRKELSHLNDDVLSATNEYLNNLLAKKIANKENGGDYIYMVREAMNRLFSKIKRDFNQKTTNIDNTLYIQAFQFEYDFVKQSVLQGDISNSIANILFKEISQAQTLQFQKNNQLTTK